MTQVTDGVAAQRLRELVEAGVLAEGPYREEVHRTRHGYVLTQSGHVLWPTLLAPFEWGSSYAEPRLAGSATLSHAGCGERVHVVATCDHDHDVPQDELVVATAGARS